MIFDVALKVIDWLVFITLGALAIISVIGSWEAYTNEKTNWSIERHPITDQPTINICFAISNILIYFQVYPLVLGKDFNIIFHPTPERFVSIISILFAYLLYASHMSMSLAHQQSLKRVKMLYQNWMVKSFMCNHNFYVRKSDRKVTISTRSKENTELSRLNLENIWVSILNCLLELFSIPHLTKILSELNMANSTMENLLQQKFF